MEEKVKKLEPCNNNATKEVRNVLNYLAKIRGKAIITGQHTQTTVQEELKYIMEATGKEPALCGFELLSYSPNINYETCGEACMKEIVENKNTLETAWEWINNKRGLVTLTWHWYSPMYGRDKSFYTENTTFDPDRALTEGTEEHRAFVYDMDYMAEILRDFENKNIPIIWRPFHESEGRWFWWGSKGPDTARRLYNFMYDRYTNYHKLNNLIWVWNSPLPEGYVGDDTADIISRDLYPEPHNHTDLKKEYDELMGITTSDKPAALAEIGVIPSIGTLEKTKVPWLWFMTWSNEFGKSEKFTSKDELHRAYNSSYAVTLDKLPRLY